MPVLAWLAEGLSSGLPPAASRQAIELACTLLSVVSQVLPSSMQEQVLSSGGTNQATGLAAKASRLLEQLGPLGMPAG
jgi:hypothetical protein